MWTAIANHLQHPRLKWSLLALTLFVLVSPLLTLLFYKPSRILFPQVNGMRCPRPNLCLEEITRQDEAIALIQQAEYIVAQSVGDYDFEPNYLFCSTQSCFESFGFSRSRGQTVGVAGSVIGPRGWAKHFVAHELIHQWQAHEFSTLSVLFGEPWMIEGMAYELSDDPRSPLSEPFEGYRRRFRQWHQTVKSNDWIQQIKPEL